ncbi:MAG: nucleotidyltransferase domain-containing protein [Deltaproteobacteria bacterium]|mgnify:FL=1|nr:nucleotidyltransferase domain-containing protein [Deltaproteobacteria bacterium]MBW1928935.1 nucleotidyltransferase domain-containing protein [Deltaproteobacteria bacterium]MBW2026458.1 nucleotidyltransferase domain-containing protein [Deltaproteobacteria bacterium]
MREIEINRKVQDIVEQLVRKYRPQKIILFGSAARGEYDMVNDLDFLIIKEDVPHRGLDRLRELEQIIEKDIATDMIVYRPEEFEQRLRLGDPFIKAILKEGQVLYG